MTDNDAANYSFPQKVWIAAGITALLAVLLWLLGTAFSVALLVLAGALIAIGIRGISAFLQEKWGWKPWLAMTISLAAIFIIVGGLGWLIAARVSAQAAQLADTLPATLQKAKATLSENPLGSKLVDYLSSPGAQKKLKGFAGTFFRSSFGILSDVYVVLFLGMFFTASPLLYRKGLVQLTPPKGRPKAQEILNRINSNLKKWLAGKLFAMVVVFILTSIGLAIIGLPMWLTLALIAGLLNFIPNFGPLLAMIPAVLVALLQGPQTAGIVAGMYVLVQVVESNFITPLVQQKLVSIPPALIIIAQLVAGALIGGWGLLLATPVLIILILLVQQLYIKPMEERG